MGVRAIGSGTSGPETVFATGGIWTFGIPTLLGSDGGVVLGSVSVFMLLVGVAWLVHHIFFTLLMRRLPVLTPTMKPNGVSAVPRVSVIIPARDEERNIGRCLGTLLAQDYPNLEIIVVDDRSKDRTAAIVSEYARRDNRLTLVRNTELPRGWTGKNYAIHLGLERAKGDYLAFVDADTWYHPRAMSEMALCSLHENADMVSLAGGYHFGSFWEKTLQPVILALMAFCVRLWRTNEPGSNSAFAAGHFIFMRRRAYEEIGGHAAVSNCLLEDFALAAAVKQGGFTLKVVYAPWLMRVRMYRGFRELSRGWTRIFQASMGQAPSRAWMGSLEIVVLALMPWLGLIDGLAGLAFGENKAGFQVLTVTSAFAVLAEASLLVRAFPFSRTSRFYILMLFPTVLIVLGLWSVALYRLCTGGKVAWRGSLYLAETENGNSSR